MLSPVYCIRDTKVGYGNPYLSLNEMTAKRDFAFRVNNTDMLAFAPADYELYKLGEFETNTGRFTLLTVPEFVVSGTSVFNER